MQRLRRWSLGLFVCLVLSLLPRAGLQAQSLEDAATRFAQQRAHVIGNRQLPTDNQGNTTFPMIPSVDQAVRLQQLEQRALNEQQRNPASLTRTSTSTQPSRPNLGTPPVVKPAPTPQLTGVTELPQYRTATSKVLAFPDGHWETRIYAAPIHYRDRNGTWAAYTPILKSAQQRHAAIAGYAVTGTDVDLWFAHADTKTLAQQQRNLVEFAYAGVQVGFTPRDVDLKVPIVAGQMITYPNAFSNADLRYTATGPGLKEEVIFHKPPANNFALNVDLKIAGGEAEQQGQIVVIKGANAKPALVLSAPYLIDAKGQMSTAVSVTLKDLGDGQSILVYTPNQPWLNDPARQYPVILDPTISPIFPAGDTYVTNNAAISGIEHWPETALFLGYSQIQDRPTDPPKLLSRFVMNFQLPGLPADVTPGDIDSAELTIFQFINERGGAYDTRIYSTIDPWDEQAIDWDNHDSIQGDFYSTQSVSTGGGWKTFSLTSLLQSWYSSDSSHPRGILFTAADETRAGGLFSSSSCFHGNYCHPLIYPAEDPRPYLTINYTPAPPPPPHYNEVRTVEHLSITPNPVPAPNNTVTARFTLHNVGTRLIQIPELQVQVNGPQGQVHFPAVQNVRLEPGQRYTYEQARIMPNAGTHYAKAMFRDASTWYRVYIAPGSGIKNETSFLVKSDLPPLDNQTQGPHADNGSVGEPVNTSTGNFFSAWTDLTVIDLGLSLVFGRVFNSLDVDTEGLFGWGWASSYDERLIRRPDESVIYIQGSGQQVLFDANFQTSYQEVIDPDTGESNGVEVSVPDGSYHGVTGFDLQLSRDVTNQRWTLRDQDGMTRSFNPDGRLETITDHFSNQVALHYSDNRLVEIQGPSQTCQLIWQQQRVTELRCPQATQLYRYDGAGNLVEVLNQANQSTSYQYDQNHRITRITDGAGRLVVENRYDTQGRVEQQREGLSDWRQFGYTPASRTTTYRDARGNPITDSYDDRGRLIERVDALNNREQYSYDDQNRLTSRTNALNLTWHYRYDVQGNLLSTTDPLGSVWRSEYDANSNKLRDTDPLGATTIFTYSNNLLVAQQHALGGVRIYTTTPTGLVVAERDELGHMLQRSFSAQGLLLSETDALGAQTRYEYNAAGDQVAMIDALGNRVAYAYDPQRRLTSIRYPDGSTQTFVYDPMGNLVAETNRLGQERRRFYDGSHRLIGETDFAGAVTDYYYDQTDNLVRMVDAQNQETRFSYDAINRLTSRTNRLGHTWSYAYDAIGQLIRERDPLGRETRHEYDALGREIRTIDPLGRVTTRQFDARNQLLSETNPRGSTTTMRYDQAGRMIEQVDVSGAHTRYEYDLVGNQIATIDAVGQRSTTQYDSANRQVQTINRVGASVRYQYDAVGRVIATTDERGATNRTTYDSMDRPIKEIDALGHTTTKVYDAEGHLIEQIDPRGYRQRWGYDSAGRQIFAIDRTGAKTSTIYDVLGHTTATIDALGQRRTTVYDAEGSVIAQHDEAGFVTMTSYDAVGNAIQVTNPLNATTTTEYDAVNNPIRVTDALSATTTTDYDAANNPVRVTDALGNVTTTEYDVLNRMISTQNPYGAVTRTEYDALGRVVRTIDPRGASSSNQYDPEGRVLVSIDALGNRTQTSYDSAGAPIDVIDARGNRTSTTYDVLGRAIRQSDALGNLTLQQYDQVGNLIKTTDPRGAVTQYRYDAEQRQIERIDALGERWQTDYDALGRTLRTRDPLDNSETNSYDPRGNLLQVTKPDGQVLRYHYDAVNNQIASQDGRGFVTTNTYDQAQRLIQTTSPLGHQTSSQYDALGRVRATVDAKGHTMTRQYDALGQSLSITDALSNTITTRYDIAGMPAITLDPNGHRRQTSYDLLGRAIEERNALGQATRYRYDALGNRISEQHPNQQQITTQYDALNRPTTSTFSVGQAETLSHDSVGNLLQAESAAGKQTTSYDRLNRPIRGVDGADKLVEWRYDAAGRRTHVIYPDGRMVQTQYDANGWPTQIDDGRGHTITLNYDPDGRLLDIGYPHAAVSMAYDADGRLTAVLNRGNDGAFAVYEYRLDPNGNRTRELISTLMFGSLISIEETSYDYDQIDRLIRSQRSGAGTSQLAQTYRYDKAGNRLAIEATQGKSGWTQTMRYDAADRLLEVNDSRTGKTSYSYDGAGQRISSQTAQQQTRLSYDSRGRLLSLSTLDAAGTTTQSIQRYRYDQHQRRTLFEQWSGTGVLLSSEHTLYDGDSWNVLAQFTANQPTQWFVLHPQGLGHLAVERNSTTMFAHLEGLGSYIGYSDAAGKPNATLPTRYSDWGQLESGANNLASSYGYTGHRQESSGLIYARNRYYDPQNATWLSADSFPADQNMPGSLNRYSYVRNNPISRTDPLGLFDVASGSPALSRTNAGSGLGNAMHQVGVAAASLIGSVSAASHAAAHNAAAQSAGSSRPNCGQQCNERYTVRSGDTLSGIGARFGINWRWIANANSIGNPYIISPGQSLYIPCNDNNDGGSGGGNNPPPSGCGINRSCPTPPPSGCNINRSCPTPPCNPDYQSCPGQNDDYQVEVHASYLGKLPIIDDYYHLYILLKGTSKETRYFRGGPSRSCGAEGLIIGCGTIVTNYGFYRPGTIDYDTNNHPSVTVQIRIKGYKEINSCLGSALNYIDRKNYIYFPDAPNSNTVVRAALSYCGLPQSKPNVSAPGW
ncbi:RHS repeat-associated core domain-containing protein [Herpetosiphon llansteffanensis]|uniref:RHS repeat-associated core domain-containing protein n=1 Tax=Herpetosiphon llansteffanensis TaxID=2094568 RepID=UPI0013E080E6|nr:RHS repeat-associated core domain-containing protein [Herpetosiphon llansteffanensis]